MNAGPVLKPHAIRLIQLAILVALFAAYEIAARMGKLDPLFFPAPSKVLQRVFGDMGLAAFWRDVGVTSLEALLSFVVGTLAGMAVGFWFGASPTLSAILTPFINIVNSVPRITLAPLFTLWFGLGLASKVALGVTIVYFVVFFNVYQGVKDTNQVVVANGRMLGMSDGQLFRHIYLPSAFSWVFSSMHTAVGFAIVGAVVGEYAGAEHGLGYRIAQAEGTFDSAGVFAGLLVLTGFVVVVDFFVTKLEKRLLVWRPVQASTQRQL